jgi:hypothetical protein
MFARWGYCLNLERLSHDSPDEMMIMIEIAATLIMIIIQSSP